MNIEKIRRWKIFSIFVLIMFLLLLPLYPCNVHETEGGAFPVAFSKERDYLEFHPSILVFYYHFIWEEDTASVDWGIHWKHEANPAFSILLLSIFIILALIIVNTNVDNNYFKIRNFKLKKGKFMFFSICLLSISFLINSFSLLIYYYPYFLVSGHNRYLISREPYYLPFLIIILSVFMGILILTILWWVLKKHRFSIALPLTTTVCLLMGVFILSGFIFLFASTLRSDTTLVFLVFLGYGLITLVFCW